MDYVRIDEGIKRGTRQRKTRPPRAALSGMFVCSVTPNRKQEILDAAYLGITSGLNTDQIGEQQGVPGRTLRYWLLNDERAHEARKALIDQELTRVGEEMREAKYADNPLPLACAREEFRYWGWIGERRDAQRYGQKQEVTLDVSERLSSTLQAIAERRAAQLSHSSNVVIDAVPQDVTENKP